ncbi:hypothetical protein like AT4G29090 [Hibiscus trionum]|uniref:RNase H type-1 domain-containing protein n=1 Tax=Hibiscus trionum TaxID=183268 RepID=A0A9W7I1L3_HIBTR|nr:hypothetical protein like AT4G29090 [Hibiscus trionum]
MVTSWASAVGCMSGQFPTTYLGIPLGFHRSSNTLWEPIVNKFYSALSTWKANNLSISGRLVFIRSVWSSLPIYYLSLFKMPTSIVQKLNSIMAGFLWGDSPSSKKIHWLKWDQICSDFSNGGLGVRNIEVQNRLLLLKWIWKFALERDSLWKNVICCANNLANSNIVPPHINNRMSSWIWKGVVNNFYRADDMGNKLRNLFRLQIGDGKFIAFWQDKWLGDAPLMFSFPRIFALSSNRYGKVVDYGTKLQWGWEWRIDHRRILFDWEVDQWNSLMNLLNNVKSDGFELDCLVWTGSADGSFSVKNGFKTVMVQDSNNSFWRKYVWQKLAPPKVEAFVWQSAWGRIPVRSELRKRGLTSLSDIRCPLCQEDVETVSHLLFTCKISWALWMKFARFWNVHFTMPNDPTLVILCWHLACPIDNNNSIWRFIPAVIMWSLWLMRNDLIFRDGKLDVFNLFFLTRFRVITWFKAKFPDIRASFEDLMANPSIVDNLHRSPPAISKIQSWCSPPLGYLKMNVDGASLRNGNGGGIGGILRDPEGKTLLTFSEPTGPGPPIRAELLAIRFGLSIFSALFPGNNQRLILESDCQTAVNWISNPVLCPQIFKELVLEIGRLSKIGIRKLRIIPRAINLDADLLAKKGIG